MDDAKRSFEMTEMYGGENKQNISGLDSSQLTPQIITNEVSQFKQFLTVNAPEFDKKQEMIEQVCG